VARLVQPEQEASPKHLIPKPDRLHGEAIINYMRERLDQVTTKAQISTTLGWTENNSKIGPAMSGARCVADEQGLHLSFYLWEVRGYILTAEDVNVAIKGVRSRCQAWISGAVNIRRAGGFIARQANDPVRKALGDMLVRITGQALDNVGDLMNVIDLHEAEVAKWESRQAKKAVKAKKTGV
jgi:hypothetical protein